MKELKRISAFFMAMLMMLTVFSALSAVSAEGEAAGGTQPVWPAPGSIKLDKDAAAVEGETNLWEVTLGIKGKNFETTSDVVLVIDCSGSMKGDKLTNTREAAKAFGQKLLTEGSTTRIAIVTFIKEATAYNNGHFYGAGELAAFETAVEKATYAEGGTNQQAGLHVAQQLLNTSAAGLKNIVILSDGEATYSYRISGTVSCTEEVLVKKGGWFSDDRYATSNVDWATATIKCNYDLRDGDGSDGYFEKSSGLAILNTTQNDADKYITHGVATIWEANQAKAAGTTIYSVALQAGPNGENTLKACATDATKDYYAIASTDNIEKKLTTAFTSIAGSIAIAASNGVVNDPMGEHVQLSFSGSAPVITTDLGVYTAGTADIYISQGSAVYDAATSSISWTVGNVSGVDNPIMMYKVKIREGYSPATGAVLDTNGRTTFSYKNYRGDDTVGDFPIPQVTVGGGMILVHWYQVNSNGEPINELGQTVDGPAYAKQVQPAEYFAFNGSTGLNYNKQYTVAKTDFTGYNYYGRYIVNNGNLTPGDAATVTLTAADSNQHVWFAYTQSFNVAHVKFAENETETVVTETTHTVELFNLTSVVSDGFIYGGAFRDEACERVQTFAEGQNATAFTPTAGATYYIWEADAQFLSPKNLNCWNHVSATDVDVTGFYLVTPVDRLNYREVGFMVGSKTLPAEQFTETYITESGAETTQVLTGSQCYVYDTVKVDFNNGTSGEFDVSSVIRKTSGYLACYGMDKDTYWQNASDRITFTPYWITLDGVKVAPQTRTAEYLGQGSDADDTYKQFNVVEEGPSGIANAFVDDAQQENMLVLMNSYFANGAPINPVDEPVQGNIVTVHDGETLYTVAAENNAVQLDYIGVEGKLFAGWFADEACTVPADLSNITESIDVYAKYVSDSYLGLRYYRNGFFRLRSLTLVSAIDGRNYAETGFIVNGERISVSDYSTRYGLRSARSLFGRGVANDALVMSCDYAFDGVTYGARLNITPYWVTLDGTTVRGETRTLTYNWYGITE
ncbi:MAG TPA: vWA domain-containing protein [Clostridia bacterium]|nr:vWA domain-containing protein [Clostridia bacterium]